MIGSKKTSRYIRVVGLLLSLMMPVMVKAQNGAYIQGQVINASTGKPAAFATVRVCPYTGGGIPCSPLSSLYSDPFLTQHVANPYTTDQAGNYSVAVAAGFYIVQVVPSPGVTYSYLYSTSAGGLAPAGIMGAIQYNCSGAFCGSAATVDAPGNGSFLSIAAPYVQSFTCTGQVNGTDRATMQAAINFLATNVPNGRATILSPQGPPCYIYDHSASDTEALLINSFISFANSAQFYFDLTPPKTAAVTACSEANDGTVTVTASNSFVAGYHGQFNANFSSGCTWLKGQAFDVSATGLSSSQFTFLFQGAVVTHSNASDSGTAIAGMAEMRYRVPAAPSYYNGQEELFSGLVLRDITLTGATNGVPGVSNATAGIVFDTSSGNAFKKILVENVKINSLSAGYSFYMNNTANANGGIYQSNFYNNYPFNGYYFYGFGDTNAINGGGVVNPLGDGINLYTITGAIDNSISNLSIITGGNPIHVRAAVHLTLDTVEAGVHNYAGSPTPLMNPSGTVFLDGTAPNLINGVTIKDSALGTDETGALALHNLVIDSGVQHVHIKAQNRWNTQVVGGVTNYGILNNGVDTFIEEDQNLQNISGQQTFVDPAGAGSWGTADYQASAGIMGNFFSNWLLYSEDLSRLPWTNSNTGTATLTPTPVTVAVLPNGKSGNATELAMTSGTGAAFRIQTVSGLPNPHSSVPRVYIRNTTCPSSAISNITFGSASNTHSVTSTCVGDYNGWTLVSGNFSSKVTDSSDLFQIGCNSAVGCTSADILVAFAQLAPNFSRYVKTTDTSIGPSYGYNQALPVSLPESPFGYKFTNSVVPPVCNVDHVNQVINLPSLSPIGTNLEECLQTSTSPVSYGWVNIFTPAQQSENYLLQSNVLTTSPWTTGNSGVGIAPIVTSSGATDPFGNTGDVWSVAFNLGGGTTSGDSSSLVQPLSGLPNPHNGTSCMWLRTAGTPGYVAFNSAGGGNISFFVTNGWLPYCFPFSVAGATDQFKLVTVGGSVYPNTITILISQPQFTLNGGKYIITTTTPIDLTRFISLGSGFTLSGPFTVSTLPGCVASSKGTFTAVTDASSPTYLGTLTGGGTTYTPVVCNGTAWVSY